MNFTDWKVFGNWKKESCRISWPARNQMCFAVAPRVWFFRKGCFELQILWMKSEIFLADLWEGGYWKYTPMLRNGISFVTSSGWEHQLTGSETVWNQSEVHHWAFKKKVFLFFFLSQLRRTYKEPWKNGQNHHVPKWYCRDTVLQSIL